MKAVRWVLGALAAALVIGALAGCSLFQCKAKLLVQNNSSVVVGYLYLRPAGGSWSSDQLGSSVILSGNSFTLTEIPPGTYDLEADEYLGTVFWVKGGVLLEAGETYTWTLVD